MSALEIIGLIAIYLAAWLGGGWLATVAFAMWLQTTKWARTAELAFFGPIIWFGGAWLVIGGVAGLVLAGGMILP